VIGFFQHYPIIPCVLRVIKTERYYPPLWFCYHLPSGQVAFSNLVFAIIKQPHFLHVLTGVSSGHSIQTFMRATPNSFGPYLDGNARSIGVTMIVLTPSLCNYFLLF